LASWRRWIQRECSVRSDRSDGIGRDGLPEFNNEIGENRLEWKKKKKRNAARDNCREEPERNEGWKREQKRGQRENGMEGGFVRNI